MQTSDPELYVREGLWPSFLVLQTRKDDSAGKFSLFLNASEGQTRTKPVFMFPVFLWVIHPRPSPKQGPWARCVSGGRRGIPAGPQRLGWSAPLSSDGPALIWASP